MEISWRWLNLHLGLLLVGFCQGFPLNLDESNIGHAQFLTGVAAILITVGSIVLAGCLCCQRRKGFEDEKDKEFHNSPVIASAAPNLEHGHVNAIANGEFTIFTPLSPPHFNNNVFLANEQVIRRTSDDYICGDIDVSRWFDGSERDFPRIKLKYIKELGKGSFGKVVEGAAQDLDAGRTWTPVVVRILDAAANARERILFLNDALFYLAPAHPNVLALKGRCLSAAPLLLLQESCGGGDLKSRLKTLDSGDRILQWCCDLTSALRHLHDNGFIHPDLAARNCLLTDSLTLKLGDYSLSTSKYPEDYYKGGEPLIPVRWRAPESLDCTPTTIQPKTLTKEANVWALGVTMWEICENGSQPYDLLDDDEVISRVFGPECLRLDGPTKPQLYSDYIFRLIKMCWNNAESRPKVAQIDLMLSDLLQVHKHTQDPLNANDDFDKRWELFKPNTIVKTDNHNISIDIEGGEDGNNISKPMSPSLNNLHGSLDNLSSIPLIVPIPSATNSLNYFGGLEATELPDTTSGLKSASGNNIFEPDSSLKSNVEFKLGPSHFSTNNKIPDSPIQNDSLTDSMIFKQGSSESDTEEENWRRKVERGAYSEKVRLKSRSVTDLMVLTHVDYSESESETPMPSIDFKTSRPLRKSNFENSSLNFSSEGNLLNIEDTFEKELKKLQVERRDSLLFVPDNKSQTNSNLSLLHELNSPTEIKPMNQIYNIFNMTIDKFGSLGNSGSRLNDIINIGDETRVFSRQDSENKSDLGYATLHNSERNSDFGSVDGEHLLEDRNTMIKTEIEERLKHCELITGDDVKNLIDSRSKEIHTPENKAKKCRINTDIEVKKDIFQQTKQSLPDILTSLDQEYSQVNVDLLESNLLPSNVDNDDSSSIDSVSIDNEELESEKNTSSQAIKNNDLEIISKAVVYNRSNNYKESQLVPDLCSENIQTSARINDSLNTTQEIDEDLSSESNEFNIKATLESQSSKMAVYTENLLPEIKQNFIKGPNMLETLTSKESNSIPDMPRFIKKSNTLSLMKHEPMDIFPENDVPFANTVDLPELSLESNLFLNAERDCALPDTSRTYNLSQFEEELNCVPKDCSDNHDPNTSDSGAINDHDDLVDLIPKQIPNYTENGKIENILCDIEKITEVVEDQENKVTRELEGNDKLNISQNCVENNTYDAEANDIPMETPPKKQFDGKPTVGFDVSENQEEMMPNSLTHTTVFTSTPFGKKQDVSLPPENAYSSLNLFGTVQDDNEDEPFCANFSPLEANDAENEHNKLKFSLETWDNFLGKSFDSNRESNENLFDSFTSEPQSMLFLEEDCSKNSNSDNSEEMKQCKEETFVKEVCNNGTFVKDELQTTKGDIKNDTFVKDGTFILEDKSNLTFVKDDKNDGTFVKEKGEDAVTENSTEGHWESGGGWFLHPQSNNLSGDIEPQPSTSKGSYIGFGMDDEIMTAIRNELLEKLPHAQGASHENVKEDEEWNQTERNEVFLRYNVYNTPLSPIPEESSFDDEELVITGETTPKLNDTDSDWSDQCELEYPAALSSHTNDSPLRINNHGHTPSQSSCCSNDTLFNFDDFVTTNDKENVAGIEEQCEAIKLIDDVFENEDVSNIDNVETDTLRESAECVSSNSVNDTNVELDESDSAISRNLGKNRLSLDDFLNKERNHTSSVYSSLPFPAKVVAPLPSPEDKPWKSLPASLLSYETVQKPSLTIDNIDIEPQKECDSVEPNTPAIEPISEVHENNLIIQSDQELSHLNTEELSQSNVDGVKQNQMYENIHISSLFADKDDDALILVESMSNDENKTNNETPPTYENLVQNTNDEETVEHAEYENIPKFSIQEDDALANLYENDINNEADYVNINNIEEAKNISISDKESHDYVNSIEQDIPLIMDKHVKDDHDMFGVLTDIRFSGPIDNQLMSTSFSESNEVDEQDWDSGSDTRSSSSGEFIWKEGEHEESLKALRAAPHDVLENVKPMEEITEETSDSDISTSTSDEEGENLEFVPSAWDKFATPTKSALRSPEKSLDRSEAKKSKGVWFKKQKYHCVYEYPREPESPVLQSQDLWKPQIDYSAFSDWEFDAETYLPPPTADSDINASIFTFKPKTNNSRRSLYYLTSPNEIQGDGSSIPSNTDEEYVATPSNQPLDTNACSQFFPGASNWIENITPDSGLDDFTPGSTSESIEFAENYPVCRQVLPLKKLAAQVINKTKEINKGPKDVLGGLRHTRNKLKLDLPPSPSAFTSSKTFTVEPLQEPVVLREKPTFSTFGKSRFLVQHVDTPTDDNLHSNKSVCFDVLPYKPVNIMPIDGIDSQGSNDVVYEPLKKNLDDISAFSNRKDTFIKGEASLLDSADEDSGIESSTLERKANDVQHKENVWLE